MTVRDVPPTTSRLTAAVWMPSRSAERGINVTRLRSVPPMAPAARGGAGWAARRGGLVGLRAGPETQVCHGQDEEADERRGDQAAHDHHGRRPHDLVAGTVTEDEERHDCQAGREGCHHDGRESLTRPTHDEPGTEGLAPATPQR